MPDTLPQPLVGRTLLAIAAVHVGAGPVVYPESLRSTWEAGVVGAVERDPVLVDRRGIGFWYLTTGGALALLGGAVHHLEQRPEGLPRSVGWGLLAFAGWGAALMPRSGFWALAGPGVLALRRRRG